MTNLEWIRTLSEEEFADWLYDEWLHHLQYRWSSSRGGLIIWLKDRKTENSSEKPNNSTISILEQVEPQTEQWHYDEKDNTWYPYQHKSCATCKHALGNWDGESNNCWRCCGADRRFYEPIEDEQTERSE